MNHTRKGILFVCESVGSLNIAQRLVSQYNFGCVLYLFTPEKLLLENEKAVDLFDHITTEPYTIPGLLEKIKLVLLGAHESTPHCRVSNAIGFLSKKTGTAHASLQHGWIQPGHNFSTSIRRIDYRGIETDNSLSLFHFSKILSFFGTNGIGYPQPPHNPQAAKNDADHNIIVATNFNWGVYSKSQVEIFINSVKELRKKFPSSSIMHRPHPAEKNEQIDQDWSEIYEQYRIGCTRKNPECLELSWASLAVSTPSTIALDYITSNTPTILYAPGQFLSFARELSLESRSFSRADEIESIVDQSLNKKAHEIPKFPTKYFSKYIEDLIDTNKPFELTEEIFFTFCDYLKN